MRFRVKSRPAKAVAKTVAAKVQWRSLGNSWCQISQLVTQAMLRSAERA